MAYLGEMPLDQRSVLVETPVTRRVSAAIVFGRPPEEGDRVPALR